MGKALLCLAVLFGMGACTDSKGVNLQEVLGELVAAERAFDSMAAVDGISPAFHHNLADNAVLFRPTPKNGKAIYERHPDVPGVLTWQPEFVEVSADGNLGYTTGPFQFWRDSTRTGLPGNGDYVSIWRRQADGTFKIELDIGIEHTPRQWDTVITLHRPIVETEPKILTDDEIATTEQILLARDREYSEMSRTVGKTEAFDEFMSEPFTFLMWADLPARDHEYAHRILKQYTDQLFWEPDSVEVAGSGDLGYTYGVMQHKSAFYEDAPVRYWNYLHIWRLDSDGQWRVALKLATFLPPPEPAEEE